MYEGIMNQRNPKFLARFQAGDRGVFQQLYASWERPVTNLAYRLTGDREEAADLKQQAFLKAWQGRGSFNGASKVSTWLFRIVVNLSRDRMRARKVRDVIATAPPPQDGLLDKGPSPEQEAMQRERAQYVLQALSALPEREREAVVLKHYHGLSFPEIAVILGAPATTVKSRTGSGLKRLREWLKGSDP